MVKAKKIVAAHQKALMSETLANLSFHDRTRMLAIGPVWGSAIQVHRDEVLAIYDPIVTQPSDASVVVNRDIAYGDHDRQRLDIFHQTKDQKRPVIVFVHGGAFVRGSKSVSANVYDNVLYWFSKRGFVGINVEYKLAPEIRYPMGGDDVAKVVDWVERNIESFGGSADKVILMGHSAGATHVCTYAIDPTHGRRRSSSVRGLVLLSGRLRIDATEANPNAKGVRAYFGNDESTYEAQSPVSHAAKCSLPTLVAIAQYENPLLDGYGIEFFSRLTSLPESKKKFLQVHGHNHSSMVFHFNSGDDFLGLEIERFVLDVLGSS
jgi:acetyl esterase/lipase